MEKREETKIEKVMLAIEDMIDGLREQEAKIREIEQDSGLDMSATETILREKLRTLGDVRREVLRIRREA